MSVGHYHTYPAMSRCQCGHIGDGTGPDRTHAGPLGHGRCMVPGCDCPQFMWKNFLADERHEKRHEKQNEKQNEKQLMKGSPK